MKITTAHRHDHLDWAATLELGFNLEKNTQ